MERSIKDWIWRKKDEEFYPDCINYKKNKTETDIILQEAFRWGKMGPSLFSDLKERKKVNSTIYWN